MPFDSYKSGLLETVERPIGRVAVHPEVAEACVGEPDGVASTDDGLEPEREADMGGSPL